MKTREVITKTTYYQSEVRPEIETTNEDMGLAIQWADENPCVWKIVMGTRSKAFGRTSCFYIGYAQDSRAPEAVLERVRAFREEILATDHRSESIHCWRARFTLEHYADKGFKGGFFQQWDEKYARGCMSLDYTPDTLEEVINRFQKRVRTAYLTVRITIDGQTVRSYGADSKEA